MSILKFIGFKEKELGAEQMFSGLKKALNKDLSVEVLGSPSHRIVRIGELERTYEADRPYKIKYNPSNILVRTPNVKSALVTASLVYLTKIPFEDVYKTEVENLPDDELDAWVSKGNQIFFSKNRWGNGIEVCMAGNMGRLGGSLGCSFSSNSFSKAYERADQILIGDK